MDQAHALHMITRMEKKVVIGGVSDVVGHRGWTRQACWAVESQSESINHLSWSPSVSGALSETLPLHTVARRPPLMNNFVSSIPESNQTHAFINQPNNQSAPVNRPVHEDHCIG